MARTGNPGKRLFDAVVAAAALLVASPLLFLTAILVAASSGRPVLFHQARAGRGGAPFKILKFRTMTDAKDEHGRLLPDVARITRVGRFLRAATLDELPELWNVLRGDMSLVGPRPLHARYVERYTPGQRRRLEVRPGLTSLAVTKGRNLLSWEERFDLDVWYVDHRSFWLDIKILLMTAGLVLRRRGVSAEGHATMPEFGVEE